MNSTLKTALQVIIPLILAGIIIAFLLNRVDVSGMWKKIENADFRWVGVTVTLSIISHLSRAYRWNLLLEPLGFRPKLKNTFYAVMVGYLGNIIIPRGGEVFRCMVLTRTDKVPFNSSFGTVVAERALDFFCLLILIGLSLILEFDRFSIFLSDVFLKKKEPASAPIYTHPLFISLAVFTVLSFIVILIFRKKILQLTIVTKIREFVAGLWVGVISITKLERKGAFIFHTLFIWVCYYFMTYLLFFSLSSTYGLGPTAGLVILIIGGLGMSAPASGGIGPFHIMVAGALQLFYGLTQEEGVAYAFVIHESQLFTVIIVGLISTIIVLYTTKNNKEEEITQPQEPSLTLK